MDAQANELRGVRVLVVEDELLVLMDVEDLLDEQGCTVLEAAATVDEALARIHHDSPDLVILDRNLDGEGTVAVAEELNRQAIPFVVMTGYVGGVADEPAMRHAPCVRKPWHAAELLRHMKQLMP